MDDTHILIRNESTKRILKHIDEIENTSGLHLMAALKRRQPDIFDAVLDKCTEFLPCLPFYLLSAPVLYFEKCIYAGMKPNATKNGQTLLEIAVRKKKTKHVQALLKQTNIKLSVRATNGILKHMTQFLGLLFTRGLKAKPIFVYRALKKNNSMLLQGALTYLEKEQKWKNVSEYLKCPILNTPTADFVQTPQGQLYDRHCITQWVKSHNTDPLTRDTLYLEDLKQRSAILPSVMEHIKQLLL
tara:strand:+ start:413 stop:1141 length:729 start_codon:yes stop_codon:yes gene_type:complete